MKEFCSSIIPNEVIELPELKMADVHLSIKREDKIHPFISGNKYRKLKYNLLEAYEKKQSTLLTFGGAFSNHIAAVAQAGELGNFKTIGIIRGEELRVKIPQNPTLQFANEKGMQLIFITREEYRKKTENSFLENLKQEFGTFYIIPEGGTNELAVKGCEEILNEEDSKFDFITTCVGTGGTIAGLINSSSEKQQILGFPALEGAFLTKEICKFARKENWSLVHDYSFGGYAKINTSLIEFINMFYKTTKISLDPVYTGKMMYGILDLVNKGYFKKGTKILAIHTGGLQGIAGMNQKLKKKNLPLIHYDKKDL
ncbi:1-aminocyclopropane-1-carboxylate deaminase/D-cysteine desulfhydrase [Ascidiimonas sp. W6]|uniref:1-aminocyclopropane-1-carboxylate deaminase/D-cysteine desulfhydrase n=1 Tax=Ascidiimonas meishanensis TaxID=3128903 RepID=UPI0030EF866D